MKFLFALLVLIFCLDGMTQAATPPAVNIFGEDLNELVLLASHNGGDLHPWADSKKPVFDKSKGDAYPWAESKGPGGSPATKSKGDEHTWADGKGNAANKDHNGGDYHPWEDCNGQGGSSGG